MPRIAMLFSAIGVITFTIDAAALNGKMLLWFAGVCLISLFMCSVWEISDAIRSLKEK